MNQRCPTSEHLYALATGQGTESEVTELLEHLELCEKCETEFDTLCEDSDTFVRQFAQAPLSDADEPEFRDLYQQLMSAPSEFGRAPRPAVEFDLPIRIAEYELREKIGQGANGSVFLARHRKLDRDVVVKVVRQFRTDRDEHIERFDREMRAIGQLDHPNIVRATDAGEFEDYRYLVMEYMQGVDVSSVLRQLGTMPEGAACEVARQVAVALDYIHHNKLVHRDIKPSNLLLTGDGVVKVLDLGLVATGQDTAGNDWLDSNNPRGTADYMSPEQWQDFDNVDIRADLYALGCTLYKLLIGHTPFYRRIGALAKQDAHLNHPIASVRDSRPELSLQIDRIVKRLLAKKASERYQDPADLIADITPLCRDDLARCMRDMPGLANSVSRLDGYKVGNEPTAQGRLSRRLLIGLGGVLVARWAWNSVDDSPTVGKSTWRSLSPVRPMRPIPAFATDQLDLYDAAAKGSATEHSRKADSGWQPPAAEDPTQVQWDVSHRTLTFNVDSDALLMANLGFPVASPFVLDIKLSQKEWTGDAGIFFSLRSHRRSQLNFHSFQSIEFVRELDQEASFRLLWSHYEVHQQLERSKPNLIRATQTPLADVAVPNPDESTIQFSVTIGRTAQPQASWQNQPLTNWDLSFAGRKFVAMNSERMKNEIQGRLGIIARRGTTICSNPQLKYEAS